MMDAKQVRTLEPAHAGEDEEEVAPIRWPYWLVVFLRVMAGLSLLKGLYHWAVVCGMDAPGHTGFDSYTVPYQIATAFFAVIDLVAAVGLWLAAPWGAVIWLTSIISMIAVELLFPQVYGGSIVVAVFEFILLGMYLFLAIMAARSQSS
jgi:hypothetical protein